MDLIREAERRRATEGEAEAQQERMRAKADVNAASKREALRGVTEGIVRAPSAPKRRSGRRKRWTYTPALGERVAQAFVANDVGLINALEADPELPSYWTVWHWMQEHDDFREMLDRARLMHGFKQGEGALSEALADTHDPAMARLRYDARKWWASKLYPALLGDAAQIRLANAAGDGDATLRLEKAPLVEELLLLVNVASPRVAGPEEG